MALRVGLAGVLVPKEGAGDGPEEPEGWAVCHSSKPESPVSSESRPDLGFLGQAPCLGPSPSQPENLQAGPGPSQPKDTGRRGRSSSSTQDGGQLPRGLRGRAGCVGLQIQAFPKCLLSTSLSPPPTSVPEFMASWEVGHMALHWGAGASP